ncbi:MAG: hypothetical protein KDB00_29895 [Planctomycetales bacterium]|nr:hypothetical protein [Planctomycetales bacterium]
MNQDESTSGYFVSDLHLFSSRSTGDKIMPELRSKVRDTHTMVLGGDIFDFKWSTHKSDAQSVEKGIQWVEDLIAENESCEYHYILGNHDSRPEFVTELEMLSRRHENFSWHRYFARLDHCLFLHGDIADGSLNHAALDSRREKFERKKKKSGLWHVAYDMAIHARLHRLAVLSIREMVVLRRVKEYVDSIGHGESSGVTDVYFGHTHIELDGIQYQGLRFHNGGAAIRGMKFRIVETELRKPATVRA